MLSPWFVYPKCERIVKLPRVKGKICQAPHLAVIGPKVQGPGKLVGSFNDLLNETANPPNPLWGLCHFPHPPHMRQKAAQIPHNPWRKGP